MKKTAIAFSLLNSILSSIFSSALVLFVSCSAQASTSSAQFFVQGVVYPASEILVVPTAALESFVVTSGGSTLIAKIGELSNHNAGYQLTITSANGGKLVSASDSAQTISYSVAYGGNTATINGSEFQIVKNVASPVDQSSGLYVNVPAASTAAPGSYSDNLTVTLVTN